MPWGEAVEHLSRADRGMARLIARVGPCRLEPTGVESPFIALLETIVYQQLTGKAAATIFGRVEKLFRGPVTARKILRVSDDKLRAAGLSGPKIRSIRDLAQRVDSGALKLERLDALADAELTARLLEVKGIGPWSVQMVLIFRLGRPDVWPVGDLGIRKGAQQLWKLDALPGPEALEKLGEKLRPWRTVAAWYLWRSLDAPPK
jgi:3-methyladenine DNA glycosylase/8-oxoguanine DNA glycosylase